jgi:transcriptional regulator with XRE-family HTH domain
MIKIGRVIRQRRQEQGLSQRDLASMAEITPSFLSLVESDRRSPSSLITARIAAALKVPVQALIWDAVEIPPTATEAERRACEIAKKIIRQGFANADRATNDPCAVEHLHVQ